MTELRKLIEAVEAGTLHKQPYHGMPMATACYREIDGPDWRAGGNSKWGDGTCLDAYHGSLDAAKALHDALLPGYYFDMWELDGDAGASVGNEDEISGKTAVRCWLIAILKAYEAQQ